MARLIDTEFADALAEDWFAGWNAHDLDRILAHYADDVVFTSPFAMKFAADGSGTVRGKAALRQYWENALAAYPELHFPPPAAVVPGVDSVTFVYTSVNDLQAVETMVLDKDGHVAQVLCHYR